MAAAFLCPRFEWRGGSVHAQIERDVICGKQVIVFDGLPEGEAVGKGGGGRGKYRVSRCKWTLDLDV